jgi:hypothetical protein
MNSDCTSQVTSVENSACTSLCTSENEKDIFSTMNDTSSEIPLSSSQFLLFRRNFLIITYNNVQEAGEACVSFLLLYIQDMVRK